MLKATKIYEPLKDYGYAGKYSQVSAYTGGFQKKRGAMWRPV
jgi:hypothetical protein